MVIIKHLSDDLGTTHYLNNEVIVDHIMALDMMLSVLIEFNHTLQWYTRHALRSIVL